MESFNKWGNEKRQLNEILGLGAAVAGAFGARELLRRRRENKDQNGIWHLWDRNKRETIKIKGIEIVQKILTHDLDWNDLVAPPGAQNWMKIKDAEHDLPFDSVDSGKATSHTIWWANIPDGDKPTTEFDSSEEFAQAIVARKIKPDTLVKRMGYKRWKKYSDKDVQDDMAPFVSKLAPHLGEPELIGRETHVGVGGKQYGPYKFEDLVRLFKEKKINDKTWVHIKGYADDEWVRFIQVKEQLPSLGQAHVNDPRGTWTKKRSLNPLKAAVPDYLQKAHDAHRAARTPETT